jgi:succinoglycan biosynthesis transport protein ExoP
MLAPADPDDAGRTPETARTSINEQDTYNFTQLAAIVRRQYHVVVAWIVIACFLGGTYLLTAAPKYTATTQLLIDSKKGGGNALSNAAIADLTIDSSAIDSQVEILKSEKIASSVIEELKLDSAPPKKEAAFSALEAARSYFSLAWWTAGIEKTQAEKDQLAKESAIAYLSRNLSIRRLGRTYVLEISFTDPNAYKASQVSGAFAKAYLDDQFDANYEITRRASDWLLARIQELKQKSLDTDLAVQRFRASKGLLTAKDGVMVNDQQLTEVNTQLIAARGAVAESTAKYQRIKSIIDSGATDAVVSEAIANPVIVDLRNKYLTASKAEADISKRLGSTHAQAIKLRGEMSEYERLIFDELGRIAESYKSEVDIAKARAASLESALKSQEGVNGLANEELVTLRELERESDTYKNLYQNLLERYQETVQKQSFPISEARIITTASPPTNPSAPQKPLILILSVVLGLIFGCIMATLREVADRGFRTSKQIRDNLDLEFLGMLPMVSTKQLNQVPSLVNDQRVPTAPSMVSPSSVMRYSINAPMTNFSETLRGTKVAIDITLGDKPTKIVGIVSVLPNEGKSTVAKNFASLVAHLGPKTILIDADLRNPGLTRAVVPRAPAGLLEVLMEGRKIDDLLVHERESGLTILPAVVRDRVTHTSELLGSKAMKRILDDISNDYDFVIVDLPPLGPVVDVRAAAKFFDCFIFVVEWGKTSRDVVMNTLLNDPIIAEKCVGVILNKVDLKALRRYDDDGSKEYYYSNYGNYYGRSSARI